MTPLQIKRSDGPEEFEKYLANPTTFERDLLVPNDLDEGGGIGTAVAFCQFMLTWARKAPGLGIQTYLKPGDEAAFVKFTERVHGLCAAYVSHQLLAHEGKGEENNIRLKVLGAAKPRIEAMSRGELDKTCRGREIEFIFVQGAENQFHGSVYSKIPTPTELMDRQKHGELIRTPSELNRLLELCFEYLNFKMSMQGRILQGGYAFGELLSEVFRNTAEHAYLDIRGGKLGLNLRCIRIAYTEIGRDKLATKSIGSPEAKGAAQQYFTSLAEIRTEYARNHVGMLEISVFDSGPGFAATIEGREVSDIEVARLAVAKCFGKHESAKPSRRAGMGLFRVLGTVNDLGGFIRARTASVEVFYGSGRERPRQIDPSSIVYGGLAPVEGSVVTIGIPVNY